MELNRSRQKVTGDFEATGNTTTSTLTVTDPSQDYQVGGRAEALSFQAQTSGSNSVYEYYSTDGDGTDTVRVQLFGLGTPSDVSNFELLRMEYLGNTTAADRLVAIDSVAGGSGTARPLHLRHNGTTRIRLNATGIGFFGATPVAAQTAPGSLTDNSGGSTDNTIEAVSGSGADSAINNNFAELTEEMNRVRTLLINYGLGV